MKKRPLIGIVPLIDKERESYWMLPGYMEGIIEAGGTPIMLPLTDQPDMIKQFADTCDGILFTGGHDVLPETYHEEKLDICGECCEERDQMEKELLKKALDNDIAILGICRAIQLINAVLGGNLYQDLPTQKPSSTNHHQPAPYDLPIHPISIVKDTPMYDLLGQQIDVNSCHHQAIRKLSPQLKAMAYSPDQIVEAVYMPEKHFVWAVQWHPEFLHKVDDNSKMIFKKFVEEAQG